MDKNYTNKEYSDYVNQNMPKSKLAKNMCLAFLFGGIICVIGQALNDLYMMWGLGKLEAGTLVSVTLIFLGGLLTGIGIYDKIAVYAGGGTIVPITGFANSIVSPAMEFKSEGIVLGLCTKMFSVAGPVIVFGTVASVILGLIHAVMKM